MPEFIENGVIEASSFRGVLDWQYLPDIRFVFNVRRYLSDQDIKMNSYLLSAEFEI